MDLYDLLYGTDDESKANASALANALRNQKNLGLLGQVAGGRLADPGGAISKDAEQQQKMLLGVPQERMKMDQERMTTQRMRATQDALHHPATAQFLKKALEGYGTQTPDGTPPEAMEFMMPIAERGDAAKQNRMLRLAMMGQKQSKGEGDESEKLIEKAYAAMNAWKGRAGELGKNQARINAGDRIANLGIDPLTGKVNNLTPEQMPELAASVASMIANGGQATESMVHNFVPNTRSGGTAKLLEWLTNEPHGAGQQKFVQMMVDTAKREKYTAEEQNNAGKVEQLAGFPRLSQYPDAVKTLMERAGIDSSRIDAKGRYQTKPYAVYLREQHIAKIRQKLQPGEKLITNGTKFQALGPHEQLPAGFKEVP